MSRGKDYVKAIRGYRVRYRARTSHKTHGQLKRIYRDVRARLFNMGE